jgi:hypothetical protein
VALGYLGMFLFPARLIRRKRTTPSGSAGATDPAP